MVVASVVMLALIAESHFLSTEYLPTEVSVVAYHYVHPADSGPHAFEHLVKLPDGRTRLFSADRRHEPGQRLVIMVATGRLTGRVLFSRPYRVVSP